MRRKFCPVALRAGGFTLVEVLVVTVLLAVMAMTVTPVFYGSFAGAQADHAVRDLAAYLRAAQELAVTGAVEHRVYFDTRKNVYWIAAARRDRTGRPIFVPLDGMADEPVRVTERLVFEDIDARRGEERDEYYLSFLPSGASDVGEITLVNAQDRAEQYVVRTTGLDVQVFYPEDRR